MSYSLNEIASLSKRAARGAGYDWGLADEAARAVRWLSARHLPGPEALARLLALQDGADISGLVPLDVQGNWAGSSGHLCPVGTGATLSDCAFLMDAGHEISMSNVRIPLLLLPFVADIACQCSVPAEMRFGGTSCATDGISLQTSQQTALAELAATSELAEVIIAISAETGFDSDPVIRGSMSGEAQAGLKRFAGRTYAPATESSRLLGAGAGTSDND
ncbi:MAG: DUF3726 domain-containing protein [Rhodobacteraceae bacterium]|nr:DUF3726 domain-containing protein [Paracoccaceae bacterium]